MKQVLALLALLTACSAPAQEVAKIFDGADPSAEVFGARMWIYPTNNGQTLDGWWSDDGKTWARGGALLRQRDVKWLKDDGQLKHGLWAPDMVAARGRYYFYYSVGPQNPTPSRLGVAVCTAPQGPCTDSGKPLLTGGQGFEAIDPMVWADPTTGAHYMYVGGSAGSRLRVFVLADDLVSIAREITVDQPPNFTEAPFMHARGGLYYLSYSSGSFNRSTYSVHYATAASPTGPWTYRGMILKTDRRYKGPGHHSFFTDPKTGAEMIAYHRWENRSGDGPYERERSVAVQRVTYAADGSIVPIDMGGG